VEGVRWHRAALVGTMLGLAVPAGADVVDASAGGFTLKTTVAIAAPPQRVYRTLIDIGSWWAKEHTYSGDSRNLSIVAQPGGCFCEKLPAGGAVEHGRVINIVSGSMLRLASALGPLQEMGVNGSLSWQITAAGHGSTVTMTYAVGGYAPGGLDKLAPLVDQVLSEQVRLLKAHVEQSARP
jgi:uncharacterized protein YndB with AHSA1/START domain